MSNYPYTTDTSEDALAVQLDGFRRMSPGERIDKMCRLSADLRKMAMDAIRRRHPTFNDGEVRLKFIELTYGKELSEAVRLYLGERELE
jgi:hypothetical protein